MQSQCLNLQNTTSENKKKILGERTYSEILCKHIWTQSNTLRVGLISK